MLHDVMKAAKGGELESAELPRFAGQKRVRAARIVALGIGSQPGVTRIALEGGNHVEVGKSFMQSTGARVGQYYVQGQDGVNEVIEPDVFENSFSAHEDEPDPEQEPLNDKVSYVAEHVKDLEGQVATLTLERDGARARIKDLEAELAAARAPVDDEKAKEAISGEPAQSSEVA